MLAQPTPLQTKSTGIVLTDILLRSAILKGLANLRAKPWLLKTYVFSGLPQDELTAKEFGQKTVDQALAWFMNNEIKVFLNIRQSPANYPCISIMLQAESEAETTLADVHYEPAEDSDLKWSTLFGPFAVPAYNPQTGQVTIPDGNFLDYNTPLSLGFGMVLVDDLGGIHEFHDIIDNNTVIIDTGITAPMQTALLKGVPPSLVARMESVSERVTFQVAVHCGGEAEYTIWLHGILKFILLAYKETLLEARGYERTSFSSSDLMLNSSLSTDPELVYSRYITLTGYVRDQWPKTILPKIVTVDTYLTVIPEAPSTTPIEIEEDDDGATFF